MKIKIISIFTVGLLILGSLPSLVLAQGQNNRNCSGGNVKYEVEEEEYDETDNTANVLVTEDGTTVSWESSPGYVITEVCIKVGPGNKPLAYPDPADGEWSSDGQEIGHIVLTTEPLEGETTEEADNDVSSLVIQYAQTGSLIENDDGTYTLTLADVSPMVFWFTDDPERKVGYVETVDFVDMWLDDNPSGYLSVVETETLVVGFELSDPEYDEEGAVLMFNATLLDELPSFSVYDSSSAKLPTELEMPVVFIEAFSFSD